MLEFFANVSMSEIRLVRFIESQLKCGLMQRNIGADEMIWSRGMFAILDLDPAVDRPSFSLLQNLQHPEDRVSFEKANANIEAAKPISRRYRVIRHDGTMRIIQQYVEMLFDSSGKPDRSFGLIWDVTELVNLEVREHLLEQRFEALTRESGLLLNILRPDGYVTGIVGGSPSHDAELNRRLGYLWQGLVHPEDKDETLEEFRQAVDEKKTVTREHRIKQRSGEYRWRRSTWVPIFDDNSHLTEFVSISQDIEKEKNISSPSDERRLVTGAQIRAARALARWSVQDLSDAAQVSPAIIRRLEENDGPSRGADDSLFSISAALAKTGIEFIFPPIGKPGVRPC